jgi:hypothetical protein
VLSDEGTAAADAQQQRTVAKLTGSSMASTFDELDQLAALMRKLCAGAAGHWGAGGRRRERATPQPGTTRRRSVRQQRAGGDPDAAVN